MESEDPDNACSDEQLAAWPYSAWVSTAVGRLSFRHVGDTDHPVRTNYANRVDPADIRYILVRQIRKLSDATFPLLTDTLTGRSGTFAFVLAAQSDKATSRNDAKLIGRISIVPIKLYLRFLGKAVTTHPDTGIVAKVDEAISELHRLRSYGPARSPEDDYSRIGDYLAQHVPIHVEFMLARDGVVRMNKPEFRDASLGEESVNQAITIGVDYPRYLAEQAYFFLRDVAHAHQHHEPQTDTLLGLQETDPEDVEWRNRLLYALHHHVIGQRRIRNPEPLIRTQGVIAYARAFEACSTRALHPKQLVTFEADALSQSVSASIKSCEMRSLADERNSAKRRSMAIWFSVAAISILAIFVQPRLGEKDSDVFPQLFDVSVVLAHNFLILLGVAVLVPPLVSFWNWADLIASRAESFRNTLRAPQYFFPYFISSLYFLLGVMLVSYAFHVYKTLVEPFLMPFALQMIRLMGM
ncbi:MAG: hypothetical protein JJU21_16270 [Salinarimonas sp.]|nr:hypothetical protein [Salinarimonas sp.]